MYDPRVGRWFAKDQHQSSYPSVSTYSFAINNPIIYIDSDGNDIVYFDVHGNEVNRLVNDKVNKTYVEKDVDTKCNYFLRYEEAKMPNQIINVCNTTEKGRDYNNNDYQIAASTHLLNRRINKEYNIFTDLGFVEKIPGVGQPDESVKLLDPNIVKAIILKETSNGYVKGDWKNGDKDVMQSNVGSDPNAPATDWSKDKARWTSLQENVVPTPSESIKNGIIILYYKGIKVQEVSYDKNGKIIEGVVCWEGGDKWLKAVANYNGNGDKNYMKVFNKILSALKQNSSMNYVEEVKKKKENDSKKKKKKE
jgi:hypothetical protein